jgi:hypothetical protein
MFLNYPLAENWVQHTKTGIENWGQTHDGKSPILSNSALDRMFLLGDMHPIVSPIRPRIRIPCFTSGGGTEVESEFESRQSPQNWHLSSSAFSQASSSPRTARNIVFAGSVMRATHCLAAMPET